MNSSSCLLLSWIKKKEGKKTKVLGGVFYSRVKKSGQVKDYNLRADKEAVREKTAFGSYHNKLYIRIWTTVYWTDKQEYL